MLPNFAFGVMVAAPSCQHNGMTGTSVLATTPVTRRVSGTRTLRVWCVLVLDSPMKSNSATQMLNLMQVIDFFGRAQESHASFLAGQSGENALSIGATGRQPVFELWRNSHVPSQISSPAVMACGFESSW